MSFYCTFISKSALDKTIHTWACYSLVSSSMLKKGGSLQVCRTDTKIDGRGMKKNRTTLRHALTFSSPKSCLENVIGHKNVTSISYSSSHFPAAWAWSSLESWSISLLKKSRCGQNHEAPRLFCKRE